MKKRILLAFGVSAAMSGIVGYAGLSRAITDVRAPGYACNAADGNVGGRFVNQGNNSSSNSLLLACPVPDVYNGVQGISTVQVLLFDRSTTASATAQLCVSLMFGGTTCGSIANVPASLTGFYSLNPPTFAGWTAPDFGYVSVNLPPRTATGATTINGIHAF